MLTTRINNRMVPSFSNELNELFDGIFKTDNSKCATSTSPSVNIIEKEDAFLIQIAAPGLDKDDFKINYLDSKLTISSQKELVKLDENEKIRRKEFSYSNFKRSFIIPETLNSDTIGAEYKSGILNVTIAKMEAVKKEAIIIDIK